MSLTALSTVDCWWGEGGSEHVIETIEKKEGGKGGGQTHRPEEPQVARQPPALSQRDISRGKASHELILHLVHVANCAHSCLDLGRDDWVLYQTRCFGHKRVDAVHRHRQRLCVRPARVGHASLENIVGHPLPAQLALDKLVLFDDVGHFTVVKRASLLRLRLLLLLLLLQLSLLLLLLAVLLLRLLLLLLLLLRRRRRC